MSAPRIVDLTFTVRVELPHGDATEPGYLDPLIRAAMRDMLVRHGYASCVISAGWVWVSGARLWRPLYERGTP